MHKGYPPWGPPKDYWSREQLEKRRKEYPKALKLTERDYVLPVELWTRVHELFDKLEIPDKVRREYAKEVYWSNHKQNPMR